ncbi:hypothetical protein DYH09_31365, partial [bacterium CPR1]|nr:hypothetical protein [bacterium CPR1]
LHYIELSKFKQAKPRRLRTPFEKWLHVLRFGELYQTGLEDVPETLKKEEGIERTLEAMRRAYASDEVRELIELREKARHDWASQLERAEARGEARGRAKGEATGEARGRAKGEATAMETVARKLLASGTPVEAVHELTGMAFEELQRLLEASRG